VYFLYSDITELERIEKEVVTVYFRVLPSNLSGVTGKPQVLRTDRATVEIQIGHLLNAGKNCCHMFGSILQGVISYFL
jgi:hypothetical protein